MEIQLRRDRPSGLSKVDPSANTGLTEMTRRSLLLAFMSVTGAVVTNSLAQKAATSKPPDKLAMANNDVKELLLLMDADNNGKISKKEWMSFMEAEFNQLDKDGNGELDVKELAQARLMLRHDNSTIAR